MPKLYMADSIIQRSLNGYEAISFANSKHANISQAERAWYKKIGQIVILDLAFTVSSTISGVTEIIFSGLPKAMGTEQRFRLPSTTHDRRSLVLCVGNDGCIHNQWSSDGITPGTYQGQGVYICQ